MTSRRTFLTALAAGAGAVALRAHSAAATEIEITTGLNGPVGLQLWSLRNYLPNDFAATLGKIRAMGFREVEGAGLDKRTVAEFRAGLDAAGLRCQSAHMPVRAAPRQSAGRLRRSQGDGRLVGRLSLD